MFKSITLYGYLEKFQCFWMGEYCHSDVICFSLLLTHDWNVRPFLLHAQLLTQLVFLQWESLCWNPTRCSAVQGQGCSVSGTGCIPRRVQFVSWVQLGVALLESAARGGGYSEAGCCFVGNTTVRSRTNSRVDGWPTLLWSKHSEGMSEN